MRNWVGFGCFFNCWAFGDFWPPIPELLDSRQEIFRMKIVKNVQIPNWAVYGVLYVTIFGVSVWSLIRDRESPNNWVLYVSMIAAIAAAAVKFSVPRLRRT